MKGLIVSALRFMGAEASESDVAVAHADLAAPVAEETGAAHPG